jgi:hypothetical protein
MRYRLFTGCAIALLAALAWGCTTHVNSPTPAAAAGDEAAVRAVFADFQAALKTRDADKLWGLLDEDSRAEAERAAKVLKGEYDKAPAATKGEREKELGLTAAELATLAGAGFLKTKRFHGKYDEVPDSKVEKVTVQGDKATVNYLEPDGDKEKLSLVRQGGAWKLSVPMPRGN